FRLAQLLADPLGQPQTVLVVERAGVRAGQEHGSAAGRRPALRGATTDRLCSGGPGSHLCPLSPIIHHQLYPAHSWNQEHPGGGRRGKTPAREARPDHRRGTVESAQAKGRLTVVMSRSRGQWDGCVACYRAGVGRPGCRSSPRCRPRPSYVPFRRCAVRVPLDLCASGTLTRSRSVHSAVSRETPSKRTKEAWAESRAEAGVEEEEPGVEAGVEPAVEASIEEPVVEARIESTVEAGVEPTVEAGSESALEARVDPVRKSPSHVL